MSPLWFVASHLTVFINMNKKKKKEKKNKGHYEQINKMVKPSQTLSLPHFKLNSGLDHIP